MTVRRRIAAVSVIVALAFGMAPATDAATDKTEVYIHSVFELFLGRSATGAEVSSWRSTVASGSRDVLTNEVVTAGAPIEPAYAGAAEAATMTGAAQAAVAALRTTRRRVRSLIGPGSLRSRCRDRRRPR